MIKNGLFAYGRFLLVLVAVFTVTLLSGCCTVTCKDVVYSFDIPDGASDCPAGTTFTVMESGTTDPDCPGYQGDESPPVIRDGGAGIIDRDGGAGIIDRDGCGIKKFCDATRCSTGVKAGSPVETVWKDSKRKKVLIADRECNPETQGDS